MSYWNQHLCQRLVPITTGWWLQTTERDESADRLRKFGWKIQKNTTVWNHPMHCPPSLLGYIGMSGNKLGGSFEVEHSLDSHRVIVPVSFGGPSDPRLARALARKFAQQLPGSCRGPVCGSQLVPICSVAIRSLWLALFIDVKWCKSLRRSKNLGTSWYILVPMEKSRNYWDSGIGCHAPKGRCGFSMDQLLAVFESAHLGHKTETWCCSFAYPLAYPEWTA
jgi:hypothetical protein